MNNPELVLVVGDMFVPQRSQDIDPQFKAILIPNKLQHVLSLGNIGSRESYDWLKSLSNDFHSVKGDFDEGDMPEKKLVTIGEFKIGLIHGHQILPWGNAEALSSIQRELDCDILLSGNTHQINVKVVDNKLFINPGSISGAFSNVVADPSPSFVLMVLQGTEAIVYLYVLNDRTQKFDVNKIEYTKGAENYKIANDNENENENENEDEAKEQNQEEEQTQEKPEEQPQEEQPQEGSE
jgi:vacuolar protein sorting-associated protein 29